jgi:hypothetical protein
MTKIEFIDYLSKDNPGFYKTRQKHINKVAPEILIEINNYVSKFNLLPLNFNDAINYYLNNITSRQKCICGKNIHSTYTYCSNKCRNDNINIILAKSRNTLKERYGEDSPLKIKKFKDKFEETCLDRFGEVHPAKNKEVKDRIQASNIETYKDEDLRKRVSDSILLYHEEHPGEHAEKVKQTNFEKTGEYRILTSASINKAKDTIEAKHGTRNPFAIHENTYKLAGLGSIKFFSDETNKNKPIKINQ